ncbi:MAG: hypothetical protein L3J59_14300 [Methylococcaceae bacterium]|nr:hypothetical protein [Methylococcaceae bacterium]
MADSKKIPSSWEKSTKSIRAVQVIFELEQEEFRALRIKAIEKNLSPSDYIREVIGLPGKKPIRPRLSISLSEDDYMVLADRYNLNADEKDKIRARIKLELIKNHQK